MKRYFVCHYHEIGLKKDNRSFFERMLAENIRKAIGTLPFDRVRRLPGRIVVEVPEDAPLEEIGLRLQNVFGLVSAAPAWLVELNLEAVESLVAEIIKERKFETFRIRTQRSNKSFPLNSQEINQRLGAFVVRQSGRRVRLEDPDLTIYVEVLDKSVLVYFDRRRCVGGLPVGSSGLVAVLLSGGIDSPVAAYRIIKRGCRALFVHFHSFPHTTIESQDKVRQIVSVLARYQYGADLFLVPFAEAQRRIVAFSPPETRVILYRRLMLRLAERIALRRGALALVTGDSIGQVASQTLENLRTIGAVAHLPLLRPLIGEDKEEIISQARQLGTYLISTIPDVDCCSLFIPRHPETRSKIEPIERIEDGLDLESIIGEALGQTVHEYIDENIQR